MTLAGARRRLEEEGEPDLLQAVAVAELEAASQAPVRQTVSRLHDVAPAGSPVVSLAVSDAARAHLQEARQGLQWILTTLGGDANGTSEFALAASSAKVRKSKRK